MSVIRVVVVDDEPMVCAHLRTILTSGSTIEVVADAQDGAAGVEAVVRTRPDVVLMDLRMPGVDGLTAIERISELADPPAVVVLTTFDADEYVLRALRAGAAGFLVKSTPPEDLIGLVQVAAEGHTVLAPAAARRLIAASTDTQPARDRARQLAGSLTEREAEVLACLGEGLSNAQIAARLYLSEATIKGYVSRTLDKLGCANRTQAGLLAHDAGPRPPITGPRRGRCLPSRRAGAPWDVTSRPSRSVARTGGSTGRRCSVRWTCSPGCSASAGSRPARRGWAWRSS